MQYKIQIEAFHNRHGVLHEFSFYPKNGKATKEDAEKTILELRSLILSSYTEKRGCVRIKNTVIQVRDYSWIDLELLTIR